MGFSTESSIGMRLASDFRFAWLMLWGSADQHMEGDPMTETQNKSG
jgi:hypothetical protein